MSELPFVVCVCVTGRDPWHVEHMLPRAVECFKNQTYPENSRHLLIVADGYESEVARRIEMEASVSFHVHPHNLSLGGLRNLALDAARKDALVLQFDDDDWHHPKRIEHQVNVFQQDPVGGPVFLRRQLCYCFDTDVAYVREFPHVPIIGTILHSNGPEKRYPELRQHEDLEFAQLWPRQEWKVVDNDPKLYLRFCHSANVSGHRNVMREAGDWPRGTWGIPERDVPHLRAVLDEYRSVPPAPNPIRDIPQLVAE